MTAKGRGWYGESHRHSLAARGITTKLKTGSPARDVIGQANTKMNRILKRHDEFVWRQPTLEEQDRLTKDLNDIIEMLNTVKLSAPLKADIWNAEGEIETAWSSKSEKDRILHLELARERLHWVIVSRLKVIWDGYKWVEVE